MEDYILTLKTGLKIRATTIETTKKYIIHQVAPLVNDTRPGYSMVIDWTAESWVKGFSQG